MAKTAGKPEKKRNRKRRKRVRARRQSITKKKLLVSWKPVPIIVPPCRPRDFVLIPRHATRTSNDRLLLDAPAAVATLFISYRPRSVHARTLYLSLTSLLPFHLSSFFPTKKLALFSSETCFSLYLCTSVPSLYLLLCFSGSILRSLSCR